MPFGYRYQVQLGKMLDESAHQGKPTLPYIRNLNVQWGRLDLSDLKEMPFERAERVRFDLRRGDLVVCEGGEVGRACVLDRDLDGVYYQKSLHRARPIRPGDSPHYAYWCLVAATAASGFDDGSRSTINHLTAERLRHEPFPFPPPREQARIAAFLERESARIDEACSLRSRMLEGMEVVRRSEIRKALDGPPRGPIGYRYEVVLGKMLVEARFGDGIHYPYLRNSNIQWDSLDLTDVKTMPLSSADRVSFALSSGDLLVCEGGDVGRCAIWDGSIDPCYYQKALMRVRPFGRDLNRYLLYCLRDMSSSGIFHAEGNHNTIPHLPAEKLRRHRIPFRDPEDQLRVVRALDASGESYAAIADQCAKTSALLREYRQSIITEAVAGYIDVSRVCEREADERVAAATEGVRL